jgi:K+-transporting ATPase KdpF subunit
LDGPGRVNRALPGTRSMASYVLLAIVIGLVIYLFYAVINPDKF